MTYESEELGFIGSPIELYKFVGTDESFFYTSYDKNITSGGDLYEQATIKRDAVKISSLENDDIKLQISIPVNNPIVLNYAFDVGPPTLDLFLYRCHSSNYEDRITIWQGKVISFSITGREAKILVPSIFSYYLEGNTPAPRYQGPCNHILYDDFCGVDSTSYSHTTTISAISENVIVLASNPFANGLCDAGEMVLNGRSQRRMITSNSGTTFTLTYPFMTPEIGDSVTIRQGCNHSFDQCKAKFSNGRNYGGFPFVPNRNPFGGRI